jgi:polyisoprenoid-binding protein YceI
MTQLMTEKGMVRVPAGRWEVDPAHSSAAFEVKYMMLSTVRGHFHEFAGTLEAAPDDPSNSRAWGTAQVASIDTDPERDAHLRSPEFFDAEQRLPTGGLLVSEEVPILLDISAVRSQG